MLSCKKLTALHSSLFVFSLLSVPPTVMAGLDAPATPDAAGSAMHTLQAVCQRLEDGTVGVKRSGTFAEPLSAPGDTPCSLDDVMAKAPQLDVMNGAAASEVDKDKTFWGLTSAGWGLQIGTREAQASRTLSADTTTVEAGIYSATTLSVVDTDLVAGNIKSGVTLFGIAGNNNVVDTSTADALAGEIAKDKKAYVAGSEIIGTLESRSLSNVNDTVAAGIYSATTLSAVDTDLAAGNIKSGVTLFGITGDNNVVDTSSADALAGEIAKDKKAYVAGSEIIGTLESRSLSNTSDTVAAGIYSSTTLSAVDTDLATSNIKSGVTLFGITGDSNVVDTSSADALAGEIAKDKKAYVGGNEIIGTLESRSLSNANDTVAAGIYGATTLSAVDTDLAAGNIKSGVTLFGITGDSNVVDTSSADALAGEIAKDKKAYVGGNEIIGTLENKSLSNTNDTVAAGIYSATTLSTVDTDLAAGNIKSGVTLFGVAGDNNVVDTSTGTAVATEILSGKKAWVDGTEITGSLTVKPEPTCNCSSGTIHNAAGGGTRWCENGDGTVTDLLGDSTNYNSGKCLVWLKNADCRDTLNSIANGGGYLPWLSAIRWSTGLKTASCGLTDSSGEGMWRMPDEKELDGITNGTEAVLSSAPRAFSSIKAGYYWSSSSSSVDSANFGGFLNLSNGGGGYYNKSAGLYVWPVRRVQ